MRLRHVIVSSLCLSLAAFAVADIGNPSSFSIDISRGSGTVNADLVAVTQGAVSPAAGDNLYFGMFLFLGGAFPPSFVAPPQFDTVLRGSPGNATFATSFSFAVPDPNLPFKYFAVAANTTLFSTGEGGETLPGSYMSQLLSFMYSLQPDIDMVVQPGPTPQPGEPAPVWMWAKGRQEGGRNVPALSLWGLVGLGALIAAAGAFLMRRG